MRQRGSILLAFTLVLTASGLQALRAEDAPPAETPATLQGSLMEVENAEGRGEFTLRGPDSRVHRLRFDAKTYFEWRDRQVSAAEVRPGDRLEVVRGDASAGSAQANYARTVRILDSPPARPIGASRSAAASTAPSRRLGYVSPLDHFAPRGNMTFAGVVSRVANDHLILRTRAGEEKVLVLRVDTRYANSGIPASVSDLQVNTRVFVRAGRNFEDELEAYQVIWGEILKP
jgi:hypothetical protein